MVFFTQSMVNNGNGQHWLALINIQSSESVDFKQKLKPAWLRLNTVTVGSFTEQLQLWSCCWLVWVVTGGGFGSRCFCYSQSYFAFSQSTNWHCVVGHRINFAFSSGLEWKKQVPLTVSWSCSGFVFSEILTWNELSKWYLLLCKISLCHSQHLCEYFCIKSTSVDKICWKKRDSHL